MSDSGTAAEVMRPLLFGDLPIERWPQSDDESAGATSQAFVSARHALRLGDEQGAVSLWRSICGDEGVASRDTVQAWTFLRSYGVDPDPSVAGRVLGVVVEVPVDGGVDVLAAYGDGTARYLNHGGSVQVVDDTALASLIGALVAAGQGVSDRIGNWDEPSLPALPPGHARLTMLTPGGHRFGQGPYASLRGSAMARPVFAAATALLVAITERGKPTIR